MARGRRPCVSAVATSRTGEVPLGQYGKGCPRCNSCGAHIMLSARRLAPSDRVRSKNGFVANLHLQAIWGMISLCDPG
jgi:hypothetical protein